MDGEIWRAREVLSDPTAREETKVKLRESGFSIVADLIDYAHERMTIAQDLLNRAKERGELNEGERAAAFRESRFEDLAKRLFAISEARETRSAHIFKTAREAAIEVRVLEACSDPCAAPCGHNQQYCYSEDGGKTIDCLLCEHLSKAKATLATMSEGQLVEILRPAVSTIFNSFDELSRGQALQILVDALRDIDAARIEPAICETTLTMRYPVDCSCGAIGSGIGPCAHWEAGSNPERCPFCDHTQACHHKVAAYLEERGSVEAEKKQRLLTRVGHLLQTYTSTRDVLAAISRHALLYVHPELRRTIVCSAIRNKDGKIIASPRHFDETMRAQVASSRFDWSRAEQGFIDQRGEFLGRVEALGVARAAGQIVRRCGGDEHELFSENLY